MEKFKSIALPVKIIIIGSIIGIIFAGIGGIKHINAKKTNEERAAAALKASQEAVEAANERLEEIVVEYNELNEQYAAKEAECNAIVTGSDGWFEKSNKCLSEKTDIKSKIWSLEAENTAIKSKDYNAYYQSVKPMTYCVFYIIGGSVIVLAALGAFIIYLVKGKKTY